MTYFIPSPPEDIYEGFETATDIIHREKATAGRIVTIDYSNGINVYLEGTPYPVKGFPTAEAVFSNNIAKRAIMCMASPFSLFGFRKNKERFERMAGYAIGRYYLKPRYMTPVCREICRLVPKLGETAKILGHVFEYDSAYRYRLQDLMTELDRANLISNPFSEVLRLIDIAIDRENTPEMKAKWKRFIPLAFLLIPFKGRFLELIADIDFENLKLDEADTYWVTSSYGGYRYRGMRPEDMVDRLFSPQFYTLES